MLKHTSVKKLFSGRSMVEMLGVLAIIGVLSIGSVALYRRMLETKKINDIVYDMSMLGMVVAIRDHSYTNEPCVSFEEETFSIPTYFDSCTIDRNEDGIVTVKVTYNTELSPRVINALADRCSRYLYIFSDASIFIFDPKGQDCPTYHNQDDD